MAVVVGADLHQDWRRALRSPRGADECAGRSKRRGASASAKAARTLVVLFRVNGWHGGESVHTLAPSASTSRTRIDSTLTPRGRDAARGRKRAAAAAAAAGLRASRPRALGGEESHAGEELALPSPAPPRHRGGGGDHVVARAQI